MATNQPEEPLRYDQHGLIPAVIQDAGSLAVLMVGWMNEEALKATLETGLVHFWSRSRRELWRKGETSGNSLELREIWQDCDQDTLLIKAIPEGPTCHTGHTSCFFTPMEDADA